MNDENDFEGLQSFLEDHKSNFYVQDDDDDQEFVNYIEQNDRLGTSVKGDWRDLD